jgi:hypothetical protein
MKIKCKRNEFDLNENDEIMFNGAVYILITRQVFGEYHYNNPTVSSTLMKKLIKQGKMVLDRKEKRTCEVEIYKLAKFE